MKDVLLIKFSDKKIIYRKIQLNCGPAAQRQRRLLSQRPRPHLQPALRAHAAGRAQDQGQDHRHHRDAVHIQGAQIQVRHSIARGILCDGNSGGSDSIALDEGLLL